MNKLLAFVLIFTLSSCSMTKKSPVDSYGGVKLEEQSSDKKDLKIEQDLYSVTNEKNIESVDNLNIYSIDFGPGLYNVTYGIGLIRVIEAKKLKVRALTGSGFGLVLASFWAIYKKSNLVEWQWFKLLNKLKNEKVFSSKWKRILEDQIKEQVTGNASKLILIPSEDGHYLAQNLQEDVITHLRNFYQNKASSVFNSSERMRALGVDKTINVEFMNQDSKIIAQMNQVFDQIKEVQLKRNELEQYFDFSFNYVGTQRDLDSTKNYLSLISQGERMSVEYIKKLTDKIENE